MHCRGLKSPSQVLNTYDPVEGYFILGLWCLSQEQPVPASKNQGDQHLAWKHSVIYLYLCA